ncbi:glycoside hydrolase family protein [Brevundimonas sp. CEF1]|uniref:glycoside hydrolase family protein n=1 Tax=Brevundimonas sp. CEF1 TaxID=3442642 RepID=UPI003F512D7A
MDRKALFDAVRPFAPGGKLLPAHVPLIDAVADAFGLGGQIEVDSQLIADLKRDEGLRLKAYKDTVGVWTIGYGHAHVQPGTVWTEAQADTALRQDVLEHNAELAAALPWIAGLDPVRRRVLQNMAFNLGVKGLLGFKNTLAMVQAGDYAGASRGMLASLWAKQVKGRAVRLAEQMRTGR